MIRLRHKFFIHGLRIFDQLALAVSLFITVALSKGVYSLPQVLIVFQREYRLIESLGLIAMFLGWTIFYNRFVKYDTSSFTSLNQQILSHIKASTATAFLLLLAGILFEFETLTITSIGFFWILVLAMGISIRFLIRLSLYISRSSESNRRNALIVGTDPETIELSHEIANNPDLGYQISGYITTEDQFETDSSIKLLGNLSQLESILENEKIDEILIALPFQEYVGKIINIIQLGHDLGVVVRYTTDSSHAPILRSLRIESYNNQPIITLFRESHILQLFFKRIIDFFGSLLLLILLSPLLLLIAVAIKLDSKGPVFFAQERVGMNKRSFKLFKFRSMVTNAEELKAALADQNEVDGPVFKIKKDPRITRVGRFIRKTSLDELPQLWNTLRGDMSLVGPRPPLFSEVDQYEWLFRKRLSIKPGITCLWQVNGRNQLTFEEWMALDKEYIENWSLWLDFKILLKTVPTVLLGRGAS